MRDQAHRIVPPPSNLRYPPHPDETLREWMRLDAAYDQPGPPRRSDLSWQLVIEGAVVFVAICVFVVLASLVAVE